MPWQAELVREPDRLREDFARARPLGRVPAGQRAVWWAGVGAAALLGGAPEAALPALVLFEAFLAPRLARPRRRPMRPLAPWRPPESWRPSPEAPARIGER
jgi:hypothetical protein